MSKELEQMKEKYASGEWICVSKFNWTEWEIQPANITKNIQFDGRNLRYQLINIKHKKVLEHVLSGGRCYWVNPHIGCGQRKELCDDFIERYNYELTYEISPKNQKCPKGCRSVLKHYGGTMTFKCCTCGYTWGDGYWPKQGSLDEPKVKSITREEFKDYINDVEADLGYIDVELVIDKAFDYIEHLESNQKGMA